MRTLGKELSAALKDRRRANPDGPEPVHLVVPDKMTADVLASIADNLAGLELSRLRWARDKEMGRPQLTWNGEPATIPAKLSETDRTAVSFLLEEDRARAFTLRSPDRQRPAGARAPSGDRRAGRSTHSASTTSSPGSSPGRDRPPSSVGRDRGPRAHPRCAPHQPMSNDIHEALSGPKNRKGGRTGAGDPVKYDALVRAELRYKCAVLDATVTALADLPDSRLREVHRAIEGSRPSRLAAPPSAPRVGPGALRAHLPTLAQLAGAVDRERREVPRPATHPGEPAGRQRPGDRRRQQATSPTPPWCPPTRSSST